MTDLHNHFPEIRVYANELSSFERTNITTLDLLTVDTASLSRRTSLSLAAIGRIQSEVIKASSPLSSRTSGLERHKKQQFLTTGDASLDELLNGGIPVQHVTEFVGESGIGKSQFMTQLAVTTQLPRSLGGLGKDCVFFSTESGLATSRAKEISDSFKSKYADLILSATKGNRYQVGLDRIKAVVCPDLELQDHMLYYQLPVLLQQSKGRIGSLIIDSIAANYRAEMERAPSHSLANLVMGLNSGSASAIGGESEKKTRASDMGIRSRELSRLAAHLKKLAVEFDIAVIVANQVSDYFGLLDPGEVMSLDFQARWFNGFDQREREKYETKVPALGLVWSNCIHSRIALKRVRYSDINERTLEIVYSPFAQPGRIGYIIETGGIKSA